MDRKMLMYTALVAVALAIMVRQRAQAAAGAAHTLPYDFGILNPSEGW